MTSLFLCWRSTAEKIVYILLQNILKRKHCLYRRPADFSSRKTDEISRTLRLMHDGISFDKILPKQVDYFGTGINWKQHNREVGRERRGLLSLSGSSFQIWMADWRRLNWIRCDGSRTCTDVLFVNQWNDFEETPSTCITMRSIWVQQHLEWRR
jgi:hypothetical protein